MTRREVLRLGAAAAAGAAVGPFVVTPARSQAFNWQRFKGKELFCIFYEHPWIDEMVKHFPEFQELTGIKVNYEVLPEVQGRQKLVIEMTAGSGGVGGPQAVPGAPGSDGEVRTGHGRTGLLLRGLAGRRGPGVYGQVV